MTRPVETVKKFIRPLVDKAYDRRRAPTADDEYTGESKPKGSLLDHLIDSLNSQYEGVGPDTVSPNAVASSHIGSDRPRSDRGRADQHPRRRQGYRERTDSRKRQVETLSFDAFDALAFRRPRR
jgi:hypothetical protein